ncbi:MAG: nucleotide sugar dehydrogenase [Planctomycetaceae bacterium]|nr:nucleotide sugar dehydrogenase [Planctomycetota bacterium]NUN51637.1 nucleotide sugar dehydrogenase [Planctomycetaceae bacterium]
MSDLKRRIESRKARVGILGLGYVGLPLAMEFARAGYRVTGFDVVPGKIADLNRGRSHIKDVPSRQVADAVRRGLFEATTDFGLLAEMDAVSLCVPTPLSKTRDPDMSFVESASREVHARLHRGMIVVLESTTYPGTTEEVLLPMLTADGLEVGKDFFLAFSPERVDPGNPVYGVRNTPKVIGGITPRCTEMACLLYGKAVDRVVPVRGAGAAEMVKLLENTFRSVNIGLVNEMAIMCERLGLDVWEVIDAAATKPFGFMPFRPGPGIGGHCIPIDPLYLSWKLRSLNYQARFIELADEVNSAMPEHVVEKTSRALNDRRKPVKGSRILVLGVAYKRDIEDLRESPALEIIELLEERGAEVRVADPHVASFRIGEKEHRTVKATPRELKAADAVVVVTDHSGFDWASVVRNARLVVDTRNATAAVRRRPNVVTL